MIHCNTHDQDVSGYEIRTRFIFVDGRSRRGLETYVFDCGCEFTGAEVSIDDFDEEATAGEKVIGLQITDMTGDVVMEWFESRNAAETW